MARIVTNNVPREIIIGLDLTEKERADFDYLEGEELDYREFARYRGHVYDLSEFMTTSGAPLEFSKWDGYASDSFFSGVLIRYPRGEWGEIDTERVIFGTYYS